jgi:sulfite reductase (NADPH) flavoprotein alpha-component
MSSQSDSIPQSTLTYSKTNPYLSKIIERKLLSKEGSTKTTYHISLQIDSTFQFSSGDSIAIIPENPIEDILEFIRHISFNVNHSQEIFDQLKKKNFQMVTSKLTNALMTYLDGATKQNLEENLKKEDYLKTHDLISFIKEYKPVKPVDLIEFVSWLSPITPRFYSIASCLKKESNKVDLLVSCFNYQMRGRLVTGLGSSFLCKNTDLNTPIQIFVQPTKVFKLPSFDTPIIMIGPGTGVAPFRAFIQERIEQNANDNWLFFGERNRDFDFYYQDEFIELEKNNKLKLSLAFSRDQEEKIYVQHLIEKEKDLFHQWLQKGAVVYVCGDAKQMAKDVQMTIEQLLMAKENLSLEESKARFKQLKSDKKIIFEVY